MWMDLLKNSIGSTVLAIKRIEGFGFRRSHQCTGTHPTADRNSDLLFCRCSTLIPPPTHTDPSNPVYLKKYAHLLQLNGDVKGAEEYYFRATMPDPKDGETLMQYAKLVWELHHDQDRALGYFESADHAAPHHSVYMENKLKKSNYVTVGLPSTVCSLLI
ncbi:hypothetical protein LXL04_036508 [Taraxacum kok-saghyz]